MISILKMSGEQVCILNMSKNPQYHKFCCLINSNLQFNDNFTIVNENGDILYYSKYPYSTFFKQKLYLSDTLQCVFTTLESNPKWSLLFDIIYELPLQLNDNIQKMLENIPNEYKDDAEFMSILCSHTHFPCTQFASSTLRNNEKFLVAICEKRNNIASSIIIDCSERLRHDIEFIKKLIKYDPNVILNTPSVIKENTDLLLYAIKEGGHLEIFKLLFDNDTHIIDALKLNTRLAAFAPEHIMNNKELILELIKKDSFVIFNLPTKYVDDYDIIMTFLYTYGNEYICDIKRLYYVRKCNNKRLMISLLQKDGLLLDCANNELKNNKDIVELAVKKNGMALQYANQQFTSNIEIALIAIKNNKNAYRFISYKIKYLKIIRELL